MSENKENTVDGIFNPKTASCREMNINELMMVINSAGVVKWSWGFHNPVVELKNKCFRFSVNGHHHKGHVHIVLNGLDLFDIYYTSNRGTIKKVRENIYVFDLINILDTDIEKIPEYMD